MGFEAGYKQLRTYQQAEVIFDRNIEFCNEFVDKRSRTHDQMVQAARSGKQNIAEGYMEKSLKSYIKLLGVSRASFEELLEDYRDYGRLHGVLIRREIVQGLKWERRGSEGAWMLPRDKSCPSNPSYPVNALVDLIIRTNYLLDNPMRALEEKFVREGGYSEKLFKRRLEAKRRG